jgi:hypothetical protein
MINGYIPVFEQGRLVKYKTNEVPAYRWEIDWGNGKITSGERKRETEMEALQGAAGFLLAP